MNGGYIESISTFSCGISTKISVDFIVDESLTLEFFDCLTRLNKAKGGDLLAILKQAADKVGEHE